MLVDELLFYFYFCLKLTLGCGQFMVRRSYQYLFFHLSLCGRCAQRTWHGVVGMGLTRSGCAAELALCAERGCWVSGRMRFSRSKGLISLPRL